MPIDLDTSMALLKCSIAFLEANGRFLARKRMFFVMVEKEGLGPVAISENNFPRVYS